MVAGTISKSTFLEEIRRTSGVGYDQEKRAALLTEIMQDERDDRRKWLTGDWGLGNEEKDLDTITGKPEEAEPVVKGNRFSGLDIE